MAEWSEEQVALVAMSRILDRVETIPEGTRGDMEKIQTFADVQRVLKAAKRAEAAPRHKGHDYGQYSEVL